MGVASTRLPVGVLISGRGSNLKAILDAAEGGRAAVEVRVVVSNRPKAGGLDLARAAEIPTQVVNHRAHPNRESFERALAAVLLAHQVEWVVLAGFMRILTSEFLRAFPGRVVNIHPSLLPAFPGVDAQGQALRRGVKVTGCTVHLVDEGTDTGPILAQAAVPVRAGDTVDSLAQRILAEEHRLYPHVLNQLAHGEIDLAKMSISKQDS